MASLRDLQLGFARALRGGDAGVVAQAIRARGIAPLRRVGIYRNNVRENFLATLEATFPVLAQLGGRDWLRQAGRRYLREAPSRRGNLHYVGERFAAWLEPVVADSPYAWFVDVARLEWAYQESLVAAEPPTLDLEALGRIAASQHDELVLLPNPTLRLVDSRWPLFAIWQAHQPAAEPGATIDLGAGPSRVLIVRRADHVELRELDAPTFALAGAIARREPLGLALDRAGAAGLPAESLADALRQCLRLGLVSGWHLAPPSSSSPTARSTPP